MEHYNEDELELIFFQHTSTLIRRGFNPLYTTQLQGIRNVVQLFSFDKLHCAAVLFCILCSQKEKFVERESYDSHFHILSRVLMRFDVHTTSITLKRRHMDVKTTSCAYWVVYKMVNQSRDLKSMFYIVFKILNFINIKQRSADLRYDHSRPVYSLLIYEKVYWSVF